MREEWALRVLWWLDQPGIIMVCDWLHPGWLQSVGGCAWLLGLLALSKWKGNKNKYKSSCHIVEVCFSTIVERWCLSCKQQGIQSFENDALTIKISTNTNIVFQNGSLLYSSTKVCGGGGGGMEKWSLIDFILFKHLSIVLKCHFFFRVSFLHHVRDNNSK